MSEAEYGIWVEKKKRSPADWTTVQHCDALHGVPSHSGCCCEVSPATLLSDHRLTGDAALTVVGGFAYDPAVRTTSPHRESSG
jgi:hypothetical protein